MNWSGLQTTLFLVDSAQNAPHPLFYKGKWWSADPVIYRGSEMGGQLSSSGHANNALLQLQNHTLPRNLSQNNSAGPTAVGAGGETSKREPWAPALSGTNSAGLKARRRFHRYETGSTPRRPHQDPWSPRPSEWTARGHCWTPWGFENDRPPSQPTRVCDL